MTNQLPIQFKVDNLDNIINHIPIDIFRNDYGLESLIENQIFDECQCNGVRFPYLAFKNCHFIKCDFLLSYFKEVTFDNCTFLNTSIDHSHFEESLFIQCKGSLVIKNSELYLSTFDECDLSEFFFRRLILNGCEISDSTSLNWDCPELITQIIYLESRNKPLTQQTKDLLAIIESSGRCHNSLAKFQHPARKQIFQTLSKYIKNENDLTVPEYLKDELALIEIEDTRSDAHKTTDTPND